MRLTPSTYRRYLLLVAVIAAAVMAACGIALAQAAGDNAAGGTTADSLALLFGSTAAFGAGVMVLTEYITQLTHTQGAIVRVVALGVLLVLAFLGMALGYVPGGAGGAIALAIAGTVWASGGKDLAVSAMTKSRAGTP